MAYNHSNHAGNMGDVFKHIVLLATLEYLYKRKASTHSKDFTFGYAESHSGQAHHLLTQGGEWEKGVKVLTQQGNWGNVEKDGAIGFYKSLCDYISSTMIPSETEPQPVAKYMSSWAFVRSFLATRHHNNYTLSLFDTSAEVAKSIKREDDPRIEYECKDGYAGVKSLGSYRQDLVLIDPPFTMNGSKPSKDWVDAQRLAERLHRLEVPFLLWYPYYTNTNPDKLQKALGLPSLEFLDPKAPNNNRVMKGSGIIFGGFPSASELDAYLEGLHRHLIGIFENIGVVMYGHGSK